jgi:hypothetical protein
VAAGDADADAAIEGEGETDAGAEAAAGVGVAAGVTAGWVVVAEAQASSTSERVASPTIACSRVIAVIDPFMERILGARPLRVRYRLRE